MEEAHKAGVRTTTHAHATDGIKLALRAGVDSIDHSSYLDEEIIELYRETEHFIFPRLFPVSARWSIWRRFLLILRKKFKYILEEKLTV